MDANNNMVSVPNLVDKFGSDRAPLLHEKPKIFLFQFCRGDTLHFTFTYSFTFLDPIILGRSRSRQLELKPPSISILCDKGSMLWRDAKARPTKIFEWF